MFVDLAGEKAFTQRTEWNEADAKFLERRQDLLSGSRHHSEYSLWIAVTGWTAWARRITLRPAQKDQSA